MVYAWISIRGDESRDAFELTGPDTVSINVRDILGCFVSSADAVRRVVVLGVASGVAFGVASLSRDVQSVLLVVVVRVRTHFDVLIRLDGHVGVCAYDGVSGGEAVSSAAL